MISILVSYFIKPLKLVKNVTSKIMSLCQFVLHSQAVSDFLIHNIVVVILLESNVFHLVVDVFSKFSQYIHLMCETVVKFTFSCQFSHQKSEENHPWKSWANIFFVFTLDPYEHLA